MKVEYTEIAINTDTGLHLESEGKTNLRSSALTGVLVELTGLLEGDCGCCDC